ncbi:MULTISPECIES: vWA domain-containing protein [unclassified Pseudofrankia]|uniref:vWA domain-containing protein n=1 Tax=unclassified Pseudofrankia TaxID=2994372 RepID=UPI0012FF6DCB|nr:MULTISPECIES: vWA domain-containing protein [unclassified Pseudofrankia]MDT3443546.1 VWA domain-containing protein [Pseudofrankia sp. BMG5.37]
MGPALVNHQVSDVRLTTADDHSRAAPVASPRAALGNRGQLAGVVTAAGGVSGVSTTDPPPVAIVVVVDVSARIGEGTLDQVRQAVDTYMTAQSVRGSLVTVVEYGSEPREGPAAEVICPTSVIGPGSSAQFLHNCVDRLQHRWTSAGDGANPVLALDLAKTILEQPVLGRPSPDSVRKIIFLLAGEPLGAAGSDGNPPNSAVRAENARRDLPGVVASELRAARIEVWPVGFPVGAGTAVDKDQQALTDLATGAGQPACGSGAQAVFAGSVDGLKAAAGQVLQAASLTTVCTAPPTTAPPTTVPSPTEQPVPPDGHDALRPYQVTIGVVGFLLVALVVAFIMHLLRGRSTPVSLLDVSTTVPIAPPTLSGVTVYLRRGPKAVAFFQADPDLGDTLYLKVRDLSTQPRLSATGEAGWNLQLTRDSNGGFRLKRSAEDSSHAIPAGTENQYDLGAGVTLSVVDAPALNAEQPMQLEQVR